ncbi:LysR substrate-binding domain-containing protein [Marinobacter zhejiangensis]|uniref:LysR family transcriptional regulator, glycine cleavage system transcriptional activator n=1 Tax=Marinobacter zhejiangensis TaxID=488535 RepID=A0A1I4Q2J2_9GAMM|nr:LysR substrate-binding domain-containing protein [Marinobacter zhejiangensis]SFM34076.1 LysR family transcriptional regulator, glycine cleavage system transcriptional activator [Marinobacter zhejiangensis]
MKKKLPPLNWLRSFEATARHLNFTQAAGELNLTQAAISQQVKGLETQLGTMLFKRLPRGLELTDAGKAYLPVVHECIRRLATATDEIFGQGKARLLTVCSNLVFFTNWLAPRLHRFRERYPEIGIRFTSNIWQEEDGKEADMEIRYGKGTWPGLEADRLSWDELFPVCSPVLAGGVAPPETPEALSDYTLLHVIGYEEGWGYWLDQAGFSHVKACQEMQFDTLISALEVARQGGGIALGRTSLVREMIGKGELIAPFDFPVATSEAFHLVRPAFKYIHPHAETFRSWIIEEAERDRP